MDVVYTIDISMAILEVFNFLTTSTTFSPFSDAYDISLYWDYGNIRIHDI